MRPAKQYARLHPRRACPPSALIANQSRPTPASPYLVSGSVKAHSAVTRPWTARERARALRRKSPKKICVKYYFLDAFSGPPGVPEPPPASPTRQKCQKGENAFNNYVNRRISGPLFLAVLASRRVPARCPWQAAQAARPKPAFPWDRPRRRCPGTPKPKKQGSRDPSIYIVIKSIFPFWGPRPPPAGCAGRPPLAVRTGGARPDALRGPRRQNGPPTSRSAPLDYS